MTRALVLCVLLVGALPAVAAAKEVVSLSVCGAAGCRTFDRPGDRFGGGGDGIGEPAPAAGPYYTVRFTSEVEGRQESWQLFYVPSGGGTLVSRSQTGGAIYDGLHGPPSDAFHEAVRGLEPFPSPTITSATVGGKRVADPQSYLGLFASVDTGDASPSVADFVPITLHANRPTPWTDMRYLMFSPSTGSLERGTSVVQLAPRLVEAIKAGESLDGTAAAEGSGFAWPLVTGTLAAVLATALGTLLLMRRRPTATA